MSAPSEIDKALFFTTVSPEPALTGFVESFWMLHNRSDQLKDIVVLPDGRVDLILSQAPGTPFRITLSGLETHPEPATLPAGALLFAVSFRLPAVEYILHETISGIVDYATVLPDDFWGFGPEDLHHFEFFCEKATATILALLPAETDIRKQKLFDLIYDSKGALTVEELSAGAYWSSRQINRYFRQQFGLTLKAYCTILRFRASLDQIAAGRFFPEGNFADQSHFIREIKRFSGVSPRELKRNQNGRFVQFSAMKAK